MAYEGSGQGAKLSECLKKNPRPPAIWLFIGSEGGFSAEEAQKFSLRDKAFVFSMGEQILKVETACLFGLCALKLHYFI